MLNCLKLKPLLILAALLLGWLVVIAPAYADSTPQRELAVVTPAEDNESEQDNNQADDGDDFADDSLIKPVEDEETSDDDSTDNSGENSENSADSSNDTATNDTAADFPELADNLNIQFYDIDTGKQTRQNVTPVNLALRGEYLASDVPAMATTGRTLVPVRIISESLSANVDWNKEDNTVTITQGSKSIVLTIGKSTATINGATVAVPDGVSVSLVSFEGAARTMVPVRFVSENLLATVNYDGVNRIVDIIPTEILEEEEKIVKIPGIAADGTLIRRVVIDAGHGGDDPGTNGGGYDEKNINLAVALKVQALLEEAEFEVIMSREDDTYIALTDRAALTSQFDAPIFVSIHCNAAENITTANGIETYAAPDDEGDLELAECLQQQLIAGTTAKDRGVKTSRLVVLTKNLAPACLVEIGFMSNAAELAKITDDDYQDTLAEAIAAGINDYFAMK